VLSFDVKAKMNRCLDSQVEDDYEWAFDGGETIDLVDQFAELAEVYLELRARMDGLEK
jgi:hypothetical protein